MINAKKALEYTLNYCQKLNDDEIDKYKRKIEKLVNRAISRKIIWVEVEDIPHHYLKPLEEWLTELGYEYLDYYDMMNYNPYSIKIMWAKERE